MRRIRFISAVCLICTSNRAFFFLAHAAALSTSCCSISVLYLLFIVGLGENLTLLATSSSPSTPLLTLSLCAGAVFPSLCHRGHVGNHRSPRLERFERGKLEKNGDRKTFEAKEVGLVSSFFVASFSGFQGSDKR